MAVRRRNPRTEVDTGSPRPVDPRHTCHCNDLRLPHGHRLRDHPQFREWAAKQRPGSR